MKFLRGLIPLVASGLVFGGVPQGPGQLKNAPVLIDGGVDDLGREFSYLGQKAEGNKLILTASNGFFSKGTCVAKGESNQPKVGDESLIVPNYQYLDWRRTEGTIRWHVHVAKAGGVNLRVHLEVAEGGTDVEISVAGETKRVRTVGSKSTIPQPWDLAFQVKEPGECLVELKATNPGASGMVGRLHRIDVFGPAMEGAHLLRVRWRPSAVHGGYDTSKVRNVRTLVFTTRSTADISSYSPITTPFGYYGTTFGNDRRSGGGFNFSMWGKKGAEEDLKLMPHLLGVGSPDGEFSGFGHEGSGVKPRGWLPMPDRPELVVQGLRVVPGKEYDSYFGYYFDHPTKSWKFYGAGNKWHGGKPKSHLKLGSFCEVPGPPQVERTGDVYREVRRRLWAFDDGKWVPLEKYQASGKGSKGDLPVNKRWFTTKEGEFAMGCGGIRLYRHDKNWVKDGGGQDGLPDFLKSPTLKEIFKMPIEYGEIKVAKVTSTSAMISVEVERGDDLATGEIYYGPVDALTFSPRKLHGTERNSELSKTVNSKVWEKMIEIPSPQPGVNQMKIQDLEPGTTYYFRVLMSNREGRIWNDETQSFQTIAKD